MKTLQFAFLTATFIHSGFTSSSQTWTQTAAPTNFWAAFACSSDGTKLFAGAGGGKAYYSNPNFIYASIDGGVTWTQTSAPSNCWTEIAASADGNRLVALAGNASITGGLFTSTDAGLTWRSNNIPPKAWRSACSSADGSKFLAVTFFGELYTSTDS